MVSQALKYNFSEIIFFFFRFFHIVCSSREVNLDMSKVFTAHCGFSVASSSPVALHAIIPPSGSFGIGTWMQKSWEQNVEIIDAWMQKSWKKKSSRDSKPSAKSNNCFLFLSTSFAIRVLLGLIHHFFCAKLQQIVSNWFDVVLCCLM